MRETDVFKTLLQPPHGKKDQLTKHLLLKFKELFDFTILLQLKLLKQKHVWIQEKNQFVKDNGMN